MIYRRLGNTGLKVSVLSFGSWVSFDYQLGVPQAKEMIQTCYDAGVNFVSSAPPRAPWLPHAVLRRRWPSAVAAARLRSVPGIACC